MAVCKFCGKNTGLNHFFINYKQQYFHEKYPDRTCLYCGEQLYPNGVSLSQFLKQLFCGNECRLQFLHTGLRFRQPVINVKELERTVTTVVRDDEIIQLIEDFVTKRFYTLTIIDKNITKSSYYSSPKEAIYNAMEIQGWI